MQGILFLVVRDPDQFLLVIQFKGQLFGRCDGQLFLSFLLGKHHLMATLCHQKFGGIFFVGCLIRQLVFLVPKASDHHGAVDIAHMKGDDHLRTHFGQQIHAKAVSAVRRVEALIVYGYPVRRPGIPAGFIRGG